MSLPKFSNMSRTMAYASDFLSFVNASPSPYHVVDNAKKLLLTAGFLELKERDAWAGKIEKGKKYFLTRNGSSIVAFGVGQDWRAGNGIAMVGAHTDSPTLRLKPVSKKWSEGYLQVGVELYGGGLWHSWFDRDLSVAGRVYVSENGNLVPKLIKINKPILRIPTLAIHLDRDANTKFEFNKESQLFPIAGLAEEILNKSDTGEVAPVEEDQRSFNSLAAVNDRHQPKVVALIAEAAGVPISAVRDFELILYDTHPGTFGGISDEFIVSQRLDNQMMSYCAIRGLIDSLETADALEGDATIRLISCFDHEEIGSESAQGARSNFLPAIVKRLSSLSAVPDIDTSGAATDASRHYEETAIKSFLISADMAHAVHPNYSGKYDSTHRPQMNKGPVIKINANQRYSTNSPGILLVEEAAKISKTPLQLFVVRNDSSCGSTIGPALASLLGTRTLDLGNPQLSMHSIRETGGSADVEHACSLFAAYFNNYEKLEKSIIVD
ncbi:peptidase M18 [Lipomyces tetrasporus]|uniref:aspartyl aminopeptidase n=1 Tax=Lipomyces tetrasporus TaxID=54092 RepID=A0AAD7VV66_9ASCO|nr:peptidase M18 [Lipomyces tetrasporus]KAJ8102639.1 peptidase M18 [Lipomyces tetrasporus]